MSLYLVLWILGFCALLLSPLLLLYLAERDTLPAPVRVQDAINEGLAGENL